jgi:hypothetical protein
MSTGCVLGYARPVTDLRTRLAAEPPSIVDLVARGTLDADLAALVWLLVEGSVPLVVIAPRSRLGAAAQLLLGVLESIRPGSITPELEQPLGATAVRRLLRGRLPGGVIAGESLDEVYRTLKAPPLPVSDEELTFLGCVLVLGETESAAARARPSAEPGSNPPANAASGGRLRVVAAHYVRPLARDAHGHAQRLGPAVLATWNADRGHYEHFDWAILPEIASRLGRRAGDLELDLHHRRDDLAGLVKGKVSSLAEVRRLIAGYQVAYGHAHGDHEVH